MKLNKTHGKPRVLHIGNIANNAYLNAKILNKSGKYDCDVLVPDYYHIMGAPEWEDAELIDKVDEFYPNWKDCKLKGFIRKLIVLGSKETKINFIRKVTIKEGELEINNFLDKLDKNKIHDIQIGDIFYNRFVPQSQFFQNYEIEENNKKSLLNNDFEIKNEQVEFIKSFKL